VRHIPESIFWIWIHLLQCALANQTTGSPEEDACNKPWRPLPSKRLTLGQAVVLRWIVAVACCVYSALYGCRVLYASVAMFFLNILYSEMQASSGYWLIRDSVVTAGIACFQTGSMLIVAHDRHYLDDVSMWAIFSNAALLVTTIHAQDFRDVDGDIATGRSTLPIVYPKLSRKTISLGLCLWSVALGQMWELNVGLASALVGYSLAVGYRFFMYRSVRDDHTSYHCYNIWLSMIYALPGYYRAVRS